MPPKTEKSSSSASASRPSGSKTSSSPAPTGTASSGPRGLGFDPDETSDLTMPDVVDLNERPELIQWQYLEGGQRLPQFFPTVPHLNDKEPGAKKLVVTMETTELCQKIAREARQAQLEAVTLKQKADTLQSEKELLEWHLANNGKQGQTQAGTLSQAQKKLASLQEKIKDLIKEGDAADLLNASLVSEVDRMEKDFAEAEAKLQAEEEAFNDLASRRHNYLADIAMERRITDHERILRYHQWQKLARAANVDRKHHVKYDLGANLDYLIYDAYQQVKEFRQPEIAACEDVIGRARTLFKEEVGQVEPLDDFVSATADSGASRSQGPNDRSSS